MRGLRSMVFAVGMLLAFPALSGAASVSVVGSMTQVRPTETTWSGSTSSATLDVAQNEFESFQIVVSAGDVAVSNADLSMLSPLTGPSGATIPNSNVTIYREATYNTLGVNSYVSDQDSLGTGEYTDALIPKVDPWYGEVRSNSFPVNVAAGRNSVAWIDVFVPAGQAPGVYSGAIRVTTADGTLADIPMTVTVANWAMPSTSRLGGGMGLDINNVCATKARPTAPHVCSGDGGSQAMLALYARVALDNRVSVAQPGLPPMGIADTSWNAYTKPLYIGAATPGVASRLIGARDTVANIYGYSATTAAAWKAQASANGFLNKVAFFCDELGTSTTNWSTCQKNYTTANANWTAAAPTGGGDLPLTVIGNVSQYAWASRNGFAAFTAKITTLVPLVGLRGMQDNEFGATPFPGNRLTVTAGASNDYLDLVAAGTKLWWYHSCMSNGCSPALSDSAAYYAGSPSYAIDQPAAMARGESWNTFTYDMSGEYYYEMVRMLSTAWTNQWYTGDGGNHGDGTLFYPGCVSGCGGGPAIGGVHDIPIESIRLKRIRDSHEDYEYLLEAKDRGSAAAATTIARTLYDKVTDVAKTQAQFDAARAGLVALLPAAPAATVVPIAPTPPTVPAVTTPTCNGLTATIMGTAAADKLTGTAGDDVIVGLDGDDTIRGAGGNDTICGGSGFDTISGGAGADWMDGGAGANGLEYGLAAAAVTVTMAAGTATGEGPDTFANFSEVYGSAYADTITGSASTTFVAGGGGADTLTSGGSGRYDGGAGNDQLIGRAGVELMNGNDGNDTITGGGGNDTLSGGAGNDSITSWDMPWKAATVSCGANVDTVTRDITDRVSSDCESVKLR